MQYPLLFILVLTLAALQVLVGGVSLAYALPAYCLLAVAGLGALAYPGHAHGTRTRLVCVLSALVLAAYVFLRSWFSPVPYLARADHYMILGALVVYLLTAVHFTTSRQRLAVIWILFFVALLHVVVGAVQFKGQDDWMLLSWVSRPTSFARASGFYLSPNHLSGLLEMLAMMLLSICIWARGPLTMRAFAAYAFLVCLGGIALTGSRTGYVSICAALLLFAGISLTFIYRTRRREFWTLVFASLLAFGLIMGAALAFMVRSEALTHRLENLSAARGERLIHWKAGLQQFRLSPIVGTGSGTYLIFGRQFRTLTPSSEPAHVHNDYLELLAEYGLVGAGLAGVFLVAHFGASAFDLRRILRSKLSRGSRTKSNRMALLTGAICGLAALLVHSATDSNLHVPANALLVAFLFGIIANPLAQTNPEPYSVTQRWLRFLAPAAALLLLFRVAPRVPGEYFTERARIAARQDQSQQVLAFVDRALTSEPTSADLHHLRGEAQFRLAGQTRAAAEREALLRKAVASFQAGLAVFPQDSRLWGALARTQDQLREFQLAETAFLKAVTLEPGSATLLTAFGRHWELRGHTSNAKTCFERARLLTGGPPDAAPKTSGAPRRSGEVRDLSLPSSL